MPDRTASAPLVSVVMIFLDAERFISEAIESVLAQTYENWELLLVDDGSTDGSTAIARRFADSQPGRMRCLEHPGHENRGMSAARNLGIRNARGELVALIDSDDVWLPEKLAEQVRILEEQPQASMVYGRSEYWYRWDGSTSSRRGFVIAPVVATEMLHPPPSLLLQCYPLGTAPTPCPSDIIMRREAVERIGGFEEQFRGMYEDQAFLGKMFLEEPVYVSNRCWDRYRQHDDQCVAVAERTGQYHSIRRFYLAWLTGYLERKGVKDRAVWRALRRARRPYEHPVLHRLVTSLAASKRAK
jgi:glycosyltransferase involved in cell wall biosynthesis